MKKIPDIEFSERVEKLQKKMQDNNLDAVFAYSDEYYLAPIRYFTDYWPALEKAAIIVPPEGELYLVGAPEGEPLAKEVSRLGKVLNVREFMIEGEEYPQAEYFSFKELFDESVKGRKLKRVGIIGMEYIPLSIYQKVEQAVGSAEIVNSTPLFDEMRMIKSENEIKMLDTSFHLAQLGMNELIENIAEGVSECEAASAAEKAMREGGAEWFAFNTIVASGPRCNNVLGRASSKKLEKGEMVLLGTGARYEGYCSAAGRNVVVGEATKEQMKYIRIGEEAQKLAVEKLAPGARASEVDRAAREYIKEEGLGDYHLYSIAHGIGITECFEGPYCTPHTELILEEGMTLCVDVGIFGDPQYGGLRVEDGFVITKDGYRNLGEC